MGHKTKSNESKKRSHHGKHKEYASEQGDRGRGSDRRDAKSRNDDSVPRDGVSISPSRPVNPPPPPPPPKKREEEWEPEPTPDPPIYADDTFGDTSTDPLGQGDARYYTPTAVEQDETIEVQIGKKLFKAVVDRAVKESFISESETGSWPLSSTSSSKRYQRVYGTAKNKVKVPISLLGHTPSKEYLYVLRHGGFKGVVIGSDLASRLSLRTNSSIQNQEQAPTQQLSGPTRTLPYHTSYPSTLSNQSSYNDGTGQLQAPSTNYYPPSTTSSEEYTHRPAPLMDNNATSQSPYSSQAPYISQTPYGSQPPYAAQTPYTSRPTADGTSQPTSYYPPASSTPQGDSQNYASVPQFTYEKLT